MRRGLGLLFLVMSVLWQSAVLAGARWLPEHMEDPAHAALHWQEEAHHHHDDGGYHVDESSDDLAHVQLDGALQLTALLGDLQHTVVTAQAAAPPQLDPLRPPARPPEGLRRPPRLNA